jgi:hypothetical protein
MRKTRFSATSILFFFQEHTIATMSELKSVLGSEVAMTVFRKLSELRYHSSYSHRGMYYTLDEIADFNALGLWSFRGVHFSRYGTLIATVKTLIEKAESGYSARELTAMVQVEVKEPLIHLHRKGLIIRERDDGHYRYYSSDERIRAEQCSRRQQQEVALDNEALKEAIIVFISLLDEKQRRLFAGLESYKHGHGGDTAIASQFGLNVHTVARGRKELLTGDIEYVRIRKSGGGRPRAEKKHPKS